MQIKHPSILIALLFFVSLEAKSIVPPCADLVSDASAAQIGLDNTIELLPGEPVANQIFSVAATFYDVSLSLEGANVEAMKALLARGGSRRKR
ncbi:MAG: hypothetical protein R3B54_00845 [Bdellovibrionota bacterium]